MAFFEIEKLFVFIKRNNLAKINVGVCRQINR